MGQLEGWLVEDGKGLNYSNSRTFLRSVEEAASEQDKCGGNDWSQAWRI